MNQKVDINQELLLIGERTLKKLAQLDIPPYPKYYCDTFVGIIHEHENPKIINLIQKSPELFCKDEDAVMLEKSLEIAKKSIDEFQISNDTIKNLSQSNEIKLEELSEVDAAEHKKHLLVLCASFQEKVAKQLNIADTTISEMKNQIRELENDANINPLTKLFNKTILFQDLEEMLNTERSQFLDLYIAIFDADDFRKINNNFGHIAGNKTLIYLGKFLQSLIRQGTKLYHTGGEEFTIVLTRTSHEEIIEMTNRILKEVSQSKLFYKGNNIHLTLSAGIAKYRLDDKKETLLDRAEYALSKAKQAGKNCFKEAE